MTLIDELMTRGHVVVLVKEASYGAYCELPQMVPVMQAL